MTAHVHRRHVPGHPGHVYLPGENPPSAAPTLLLIVGAFVAGVAVGVALDGCERPAFAAGEAPAPRACGPACRWSSAVAERTRAAWPDVVAAAALEGQDPVLLASIAAYESGMLPVRGGLRNEMWGPGQVHCRTWLRHLRRRHGAPGLTCGDLLTVQWGLAGAALVLRHAMEEACGQRAKALCLYGVGPKAAGWRSCAYARDVLAVEALLRRDLADLVEERV